MRTSSFALVVIVSLAGTLAAGAQSQKPTSPSDRQIHIEQVVVRCEGDQEKKFEVKPSAYFFKKCEGKHKCSATLAFVGMNICPKGKKQLVATVRCGAEQKDLTSFGRHAFVCTQKQFTIDGK